MRPWFPQQRCRVLLLVDRRWRLGWGGGQGPHHPGTSLQHVTGLGMVVAVRHNPGGLGRAMGMGTGRGQAGTLESGTLAHRWRLGGPHGLAQAWLTPS